MSADVTATLAALLVIWLAAKLGGEVIERLGQPAVLGELLAGVLIGPGVLGLVRESDVLHVCRLGRDGDGHDLCGPAVGCGLELDRWIKPGDVVELEIEASTSSATAS